MALSRLWTRAKRRLNIFQMSGTSREVLRVTPECSTRRKPSDSSEIQRLFCILPFFFLLRSLNLLTELLSQLLLRGESTLECSHTAAGVKNQRSEDERAAGGCTDSGLICAPSAQHGREVL